MNKPKTPSQSELNLMFHSDPGHGWLEVPSHLIADDLRKTISPYSYEHKGTAFLEEDCDMGRFLNWMKSNDIPYNISEINTNKDHYCRNWPSFKGRNS